MPKKRPSQAAAFTWRALPPMQYPRADPVALPLEDGRVLVAGKTGWLWNRRQGTVRRDDLQPEVCDSKLTQWEPAPGLVDGDGKLIGVRGLYWDPTRQDWIKIDHLPPPPAIGSLELPSGTKLVAGGEKYEPNETFPTALDTIVLSPPTGRARSRRLKTPRIWATLTHLPDERVLVTGGYRIDVYFYDHDKPVPAEEAEVIETTQGKVVPGGLLVKPRYQHAVALLPDGSVILAGGAGESSASLAEVEIGHPITR